MAATTVCGGCGSSFSMNSFSSFKDGKCPYCQKREELERQMEDAKSRDLEEMILGKSE